MKKTVILAILLIASQATQLNAWGWSSSSESSSETSSVTSAQGGTVIVGGQAYKTEPGQTLQISGGGVHAQMNTVQEDGKEPVTTMNIEESEPVVAIDGKVAQPIADENEDLDDETEDEDADDNDMEEIDADEDNSDKE